MKELIESICVFLSWKLPRGLVYWCFVRVVTENCLGNPGDRTAHDAAESWMSRPTPRTLEQELRESQPPTAKKIAIATMKHVHRVCNQSLDSGNWMDTTTVRSIRDSISAAWVKLENEK